MNKLDDLTMTLDNLRGRSYSNKPEAYIPLAIAYTLIRYCQQPWYKRLRRFR